jgi:hypothetical protein
LSDGNRAEQARTAETCATATVERLPRELRDIVYECLWRTTNFNHNTIKNCNSEEERPFFITPRIVGSCFAREAAQWYFEHGCMGQPMALDSLRMTLGADIFGTGTIAKACKLRSLCITIDSTSLGNLGTTGSFNIIEEKLRALLKLELSSCFVLTTRVVWDHWQYIDTRRLQELAPALSSVFHAFKQSGHKTVLEYRVYPCYSEDFLNLRAWLNQRAWVQALHTTHFASQAREFHLIRGTEAERLLNATSQGWYFYLRQQDVLKISNLIF